MAEAHPQTRTRFHWLKLRATSHGTEDPDRVAQALRAVAGDDELAVATTTVESHHGGDVLLVEATIERQRDIRGALDRLLGPDAYRDQVARQLDARVDDDGVLYLRFDKQDASLGTVRLTMGDDAVQVRVKVEVHPSGRARALAAWRAWLGV